MTVGRVLAAWLLLAVMTTAALACVRDSECGCDGTALCEGGACEPAFTLPVFPVGTPGAGPYATSIIAVLDHAGSFYTGCCDTEIVAFTGERAVRSDDAALCPVDPTFPACLFASCLCGYASGDGAPFVVNGNYTGVVGSNRLQYDGHAGYDYVANAGTPLVATRDGMLCKAVADPVNGTSQQPTAWDGFHTFYVDHGAVAGFGWASWYLHAADLSGTASDGRNLATLAPGECAPVVAGQLVATAGNAGTLVPHLHFEVRRYAPSDGPEAASARVVDPYGWRGAAPDPWSVPGGNPQAVTHGPAVWRGCGNGRVECGEACDGGACCTAACTLAASGTTCSASTNPCADERCTANGACVDQAAPRPDCRPPTVPHAATLALHAPTHGGGRLQWKWRRGAATASDFGDPRATTSYRLCAFTESGPPSLVFGAAVPAGGQCPSTATTPCWKGLGSPSGARGYRYRNRDGAPDGVDVLQLQPGAVDTAKITLKARGPQLAVPVLPLVVPLRVQLSSAGGACFEARFDAAGVRRNDAGRFTAASE